MGVKVGKEITRFFSRRKNGDVTLVKQLAGDETRNTGSTSYERGYERTCISRRRGRGQKVPCELRRPLHTRRKKSSRGGGNELRIRSVFPCTAKKKNVTGPRLTLPARLCKRAEAKLRSRSQCCSTLHRQRVHVHESAIRCTFALPFSIGRVPCSVALIGRLSLKSAAYRREKLGSH